MNNKKEVKSILTKGEILNGIEKLLSLDLGNCYESAVRTYSSKFYKLQQNFNLGLISFDEKERVQSQIILGLIELTNECDFNSTSLHPKVNKIQGKGNILRETSLIGSILLISAFICILFLTVKPNIIKNFPLSSINETSDLNTPAGDNAKTPKSSGSKTKTNKSLAKSKKDDDEKNTIKELPKIKEINVEEAISKESLKEKRTAADETNKAGKEYFNGDTSFINYISYNEKILGESTNGKVENSEGNKIVAPIFQVEYTDCLPIKKGNDITKTFEVTLITNSKQNYGEILVDGKPAIVLSDNLSVKKIRVKAKNTNHKIEIITDKTTCLKSVLVENDIKSLILNCRKNI